MARSRAAMLFYISVSHRLQSPDYREKIWDHAAGAVIIEEAGGRVTDMYGEQLDFGTHFEMRANRGVVACNEALHASVLQTLAPQSSAHV